MAIAPTGPEWRKLPVSLSELCIDTTLRCGQAFRWRKINDEWTSTLHGRILSLKQDPLHLHYRVLWPDRPAPPPNLGIPSGSGLGDQDDTYVLLRRYFSLDLNLGALYKQWSEADPNFRRRSTGFSGVRILNQDAWEALVCFICSSINNISRISQMVLKLCRHYGPLIGHIGDEALHDFPAPESLTGNKVECHLRELGFGYRAKYIAETARVIALHRPAFWLESLRNPAHQGLRSLKEAESPSWTYKGAHEELLSLAGVGPKVADCVCLMGLGWGESVPVDTHVWHIAQRDYRFGKTKSKTFNNTMYNAVGDHFRKIWGDYAGWAHSVLFTADLRKFSDRSIKQETNELQTDSEKEYIEGKSVTRSRKRQTVVEAETKVAVRLENALEVDGLLKRRRTRKIT